MSADKPTRGSKSQPRSDFRRLSRRFMSGLLRSLFFINRSTRHSRAGFVLPTTVLLLLVMTLTVGALSFRSFSRTQSTFLAREQQVIDNVAAPAADRAKSKLEYLFDRDSRFPGSTTPASDLLATLMSNRTNTAVGVTALGTDPYTLPGETRIDINNDGIVDNAWKFFFDLNGDGREDKNEIIAYSILMDDAVDQNPTPTPSNRNDDVKIEDVLSQTKANALVTRNGPINTDETLAACGGSREPDQGWFPVNTAQLEKNFQITAFVSNGKSVGRTNSALELQQVRRAIKGNRWGAWFKYDVEVFPGADFKWNGAIHSDGNIMIDNKFEGLMISSHNSCLYSKEASAITLAEVDNDNDDDIEPATGDFQGQLLVGHTSKNTISKSGDPKIHIFTSQNAAPETNTTAAKLTIDNDSIDTNGGIPTPSEISLNPLELFTRNESRHRDTSKWKRATGWETNTYRTKGRVINENQRPPYLDDFYRADDRYGPRPAYDSVKWVTDTDDGANTADDKQLGDEIRTSDPSSDTLINATAGLDGYWERQAKTHGMRLVVGQRLELGNKFGWGGNADPLYPPTAEISNKQRQRRTLRDNLAAVQGMVVYHYESSGGNFPLACIASTAHPGTLEILRASRTFARYPAPNADIYKMNFLTGEGTNGWEFDFPSVFDTEAKFGAELAKNKPLGIALRNLAYFAGDPRGGAPSFRPIQDGAVHPFPHQSMWGNYSTLRRIFDDELDNTTGNIMTSSPAWRSASNPPSLASMADRYNALSPADKSSLHSAACTLGMLAYNLSYQQDADKAVLLNAIPNQGSANGIGAQLMDAIGARNSGPVGSAATGCTVVTGRSYDYDCRSIQIDKDAVISATGISSTQQAAVKLVGSLEQIKRDRLYGFRAPSSTTLVEYIGKRGSKQYLFSFPAECNPDDPNSVVADLFEGVGNGLTDSKAAFALMCAPAAPKYPSLYYLFPKADHSQIGSGSLAQPPTEEYVNQTYLTDSSSGVNRSVTYRVVGDDGTTPSVEDPGDAGIAAIAFTPRFINDFKLPRSTPVGGPSTPLNPESMDIKLPNGTLVSVSLLDKVMHNGREGMAVRVLDVDLGRLTRNTNPNGSDYWVSNKRESVSGIIYAAREDAAREDAFVRPAAGTWANCKTLDKIASSSISNNCRMRPSRLSANGGPTDPPLSKRNDGSSVGISIKPINFAPDPDRRPYGFRLNANLGSNDKGDISKNKARTWGLSFVTDNAAYIKGNFNPHSTNGDDVLEEFKSPQTLFDHASLDFYNGRTRPNLNTGAFAVSSIDRWRVAEILADAVTILSDGFVDGAITEGFTQDRTEVSPDFGNALTSFHNQQRPLQEASNNELKWANGTGWLRENNAYSSTASSNVPIWVGRNGESKTVSKTFSEAENDGDFLLPDELTGLDTARDALFPVYEVSGRPKRVNATIISGIVPSRAGQGYGGLHNFPRFLEEWEPKVGGSKKYTDLFIQGAFLQLNFSTASTGPFDVDSWNPGENGINGETLPYYKPPGRQWGYDVALQYAPAGPIAQRFVSIERPRSEHYRELSIEDPYVKSLRCAKLPNGTKVFDNGSCP